MDNTRFLHATKKTGCDECPINECQFCTRAFVSKTLELFNGSSQLFDSSLEASLWARSISKWNSLVVPLHSYGLLKGWKFYRNFIETCSYESTKITFPGWNSAFLMEMACESQRPTRDVSPYRHRSVICYIPTPSSRCWISPAGS